ncbi:ABC transporter permease subunit [Luteolibacter pohnpeiensis]|uniref:ABC transporter permease subunit n=1 Tax=Luteolibacter pohnpeiensis TaxID=454153 RepID=A0A934S7Q6_9BACT|nr:ABC transporter permease subunit [Luteolibacter pohnpeiensis]MBK1883727.1 ABC transporter permease subunit [Luteolibacter pohnpeiensis]
MDPLPPPDPKRFEVSRGTLLFDRFMGIAIRLGGISVILAVFGIFYFIGKEVVPLFQSAEVKPVGMMHSDVPPAVMGVDEWGKLPFFYNGGDKLVFIQAKDQSRKEVDLPDLNGGQITAFSYDPVHQRVALGLADGQVGSFAVHYQQTYEDGKLSGVDASVEEEPFFQLEHGDGPVTEISYGDSGTGRIIAAKREGSTGSSVSIVQLGMKRSLLGKGKLSLIGETEVSTELPAPASLVRSSQNGAMVLIACENGEVAYFLADSEGVSKRQTFKPFDTAVPRQINFLFGGVSIIVTGSDGEQSQWSLFRKNGEGERLFGETKTFPNLPQGKVLFAGSQRNRSFLTGAGKHLSIRHSTSGAVRWEGETDLDPVAAVLDAKGENFIVAAADGSAERYSIHDPHPDSSWRAFFGKVWYEGGSEPVYQWQSTGGTDDFEPKLSLIPLIFGSLKGTFYALLFSIPVALLAALFSAAFLPPDIKKVVKPTMEIMSSLPSVVLGFLAGLWLAPILENRVPSVLLMLISIPLTALLTGFVWCRLPIQIRNRFEGGREWLVVLPFLALAAWLSWSLGPVIEKIFFVYKDPATGKEIADFRVWWPHATGARFEQRNSLVLGFMMGFAVIPVIFTIAEDALSNVPKSLTAAASALGANRWQVVWTVMLPVASSGIFSALMIGFGRAVGETMIMVMATGNTPVTQWNIFNGMRTLSANIAVELPEASEGSTHYRTLFLGAVVLFAMTFVMNTIAEVLRQRLRERNKLV